MVTRNVRPFVHLRVLSSYSLGLALSTPDDICRHARRVGYDTVALTDVNGTYGFMELHRAAREVGVKPVYGTILYLDWNNPPADGDPVQSLILLALDRTGLKHVCAAASIAARRREAGDGLYFDDVDELTDGVVAIAGVDLRRVDATFETRMKALSDRFSDRVFVEYRDGLAGESAQLQRDAMRIAHGAGVSPVLVQDVRFVGPTRSQLADLAGTVDDPGYEHRVFGDARAGDAGPGHGMRTAAEMSAAHDENPEAHANASLIGSLVQPDLFEALEDHPGPSPAAEMFDPAHERRETLRARVRAGLDAHMPGAPDSVRAVVDAELQRIEAAGLEDRFLQYERILRRIREAAVTLGPATGLSLQSRSAFLLGITTFDPYHADDRFDPEFEAPLRDTRILDLQIAPEQRPRRVSSRSTPAGRCRANWSRWSTESRRPGDR
jgi:DNA polymerase III alpha subunit